MNFFDLLQDKIGLMSRKTGGKYASGWQGFISYSIKIGAWPYPVSQSAFKSQLQREINLILLEFDTSSASLSHVIIIRSSQRSLSQA